MYIYRAKCVVDSGFETNIPNAVTSKDAVKVFDIEYIEDAYEEILKAEKEGLIKIVRFEEMTDKRKEWLGITIKEEYKNAVNHPEYRHFLKRNSHLLLTTDTPSPVTSMILYQRTSSSNSNE